MAMHAGMTGSTSGTVAGTRVGVHVMPPGSSRSSSGNGAVMPSTPIVVLPPGSVPEVRVLTN